MIRALRHSHDIGQRVIRRQVVGRAGGRRKAVGMGLAAASAGGYTRSGSRGGNNYPVVGVVQPSRRAARPGRIVASSNNSATAYVLRAKQGVVMRRQLRHTQGCGPNSAGQTVNFGKKIMTGGRYVV